MGIISSGCADPKARYFGWLTAQEEQQKLMMAAFHFAEPFPDTVSLCILTPWQGLLNGMQTFLLSFTPVLWQVKNVWNEKGLSVRSPWSHLSAYNERHIFIQEQGQTRSASQGTVDNVKKQLKLISVSCQPGQIIWTITPQWTASLAGLRAVYSKFDFH